MEENKKPPVEKTETEVGLTIVSVGVLLVFLVFMTLNAKATIDVINGYFWSIIAYFGPISLTVSFIIFILACYLTFGKYGKVRLGDCKPEYGTYNYVIMMMLASLASAALYWSFVEWAFYYETPGLGIEPRSKEALEVSLAYQWFHWGITHQAMYTVMATAIAYGVFVRKVPSFQTSAVCSAMMGEKVKGKSAIGKVIDFIVIFGVLGALSSSLGLCVPLAAGGLNKLFGIETTPFIQIGIIAFIAAVYTFTAYLGTAKGMKVLTEWTSYVCIAFILYVFATGPTSFIMKNMVSTLGHMIDKTILMSLFSDPINNSGFSEGWTVYYQAFYYNYLAMMAIFVATISKGRTIKELGLATMLGISVGGWFLFGVNGSFAINAFTTEQVDVVALANSGIGEVAVYSILEILPLGSTLLPIFILLLIVGFVAPSMDSASLALAETTTKRGVPKMAVRIFWCALLAVIPLCVVVTGSGFDAIKKIAILISIPFVPILVGMAIGLLKWLHHDEKSGLIKRNIELQEKEMQEEFEKAENKA